MNETVRTEFLLHVQYSKYANKINLQIKKNLKKRCALHSEQRQCKFLL